MDYKRGSKRLSYHAWEIRSHLTSASIDGTVAAGAMLHFDETCECHIIPSKKFPSGGEAIQALEIKASLCIDESESHPGTSTRTRQC
ncbi:hypothetical protein [Variovorax saccharolyticus]|uniref:hypothetical protein n=1 Tax=Variovorax saccharolyticus TaxID=3053516 RepID=UPI002577CB85|nr:MULTISPECIES: hypothetical protein [unclassified Variovorax]MDM0022516.1 hypothetical protein [Variovorax sp. J22R187]MDM0028281.1 hypothetical protein [Variovorax sp. J31P216]